MKPNNNPLSTYGLVAGVVGQVGCLILLVILGAMLLGWGVDELFGTRPAMMFIMLLASVPVSIAAIFFYTRYKAKQLHGSAVQKEEDISE
ncbi:MAG: AtpZ/AtpI family protein [Chloroflexota bacterium]|nr:AtpZ/AtpI family protein [Chloroflexota bacterium]